MMDENSIDQKRRLNREKVQRWRANQSLKIGRETERSRKVNVTEEPASQRLNVLSQRLSILEAEERIAEVASIRKTAKMLSQKMRMSQALKADQTLFEKINGCKYQEFIRLDVQALSQNINVIEAHLKRPDKSLSQKMTMAQTLAPVDIKLTAQALSQKMRLSQNQSHELALSQKMVVPKVPEQAREPTTAFIQEMTVPHEIIVTKIPEQLREPTPAFIQEMTVSQEIIVTEIPEQAQVPEKAKVSKKIKVKRPVRSLAQKKKVSNISALAEVKLAAQALSQKMRVSQTQKAKEKLALEALFESGDGASDQDQSTQLAPALSKRSRVRSNTIEPARKRPARGLSKRSRKMSENTEPIICDSEINFVENELYQHICGTMDHIQNLWNELEP